MRKRICDKKCESCVYRIRNVCDGENFKIINCASGQPNIEPRNVRNLLKEVLDSKYLGYTSFSGIYPLKKAICDYENQKNLEIKPEQLIVTSGGRGSLFLTLLTCLNPGEEVLLPNPTWSQFKMLIKSVKGRVISTNYFENQKFVPENITEAITKNTKFILVNTPENPTGRVIRPKVLKEIAKIAEDYDLTIISDEVYDHFIYDGLKHVSIFQFAPERTILVNAISKTFSMTGWRVGWIISSLPTIKNISKYNNLRLSNPSVIAQYAALLAFTSEQNFTENIVTEFEKRRNLLMQHMSELGWDFIRPEGAIFAFPNIGKNSRMFAAQLYKKMKVRIGFDLGDYSTYSRIAYAAVTRDEINEAFERIKKII